MRADWIETKFLPKEVGTYLVCTCNDKIIIDRWDGDCWGKCRPTAKGKGHYRLHRAWTTLPPAYKEIVE